MRELYSLVFSLCANCMMIDARKDKKNNER